MKPYNRHILACNGKDCKKAGGGKKLLKKLRKKLGKKEARFTKCTKVKCLGACKKAPVLVVYPDGVWYRCPDKAALKAIISEHLQNNRVVDEHTLLVMEEPSTK